MFKKAIIAGAILASIGVTHAFAAPVAPTADLKVIGTISPNACTIKLGDAGTVNYGPMSKDYIETNLTDVTTAWKAAAVPISLAITCDSPIKISIGLADKRSGTASPVDTGDAYGYGLSVDPIQNKKIGQYRVDFSAVTISPDASAPVAPGALFVRPMFSATPFAAATVGLQQTNFSPSNDLSFTAVAAGLTPGPIKVVTGNLNVVSYFNKDILTNLNDTVTIDGLSTFTVNYI